MVMSDESIKQHDAVTKYISPGLNIHEKWLYSTEEAGWLAIAWQAGWLAIAWQAGWLAS